MAEEQEKTFTQADIDKLNAEHEKAIKELNERHSSEIARKVDAAIKKTQAELEEAAKKATMSETEKLNAELEEYKTKYQAEADKTALAEQKEQARAYMAELGVDVNNLDFVFVPKDLEATKNRAKAFKEMIDGVKKTTFENNVKSTVPNAGQPPTAKDDFEDGFDNGITFKAN